MKSSPFPQETPIEAIGLLLMAVEISAPSSRTACRGLVRSSSTRVSLVRSQASAPTNGLRTQGLLLTWATKAIHFAHGRNAAFTSRTRGLAQHDV
jgi:hypothetical protein